MLSAQWQGFAHAIGHVDGLQTAQQELIAKVSQKAHDDCEGAYDAVTLAALHGLPNFLTVLLDLEQVKIRFYETYQVSLPPQHPFEARAPPTLNS